MGHGNFERRMRIQNRERAFLHSAFAFCVLSFRGHRDLRPFAVLPRPLRLLRVRGVDERRPADDYTSALVREIEARATGEEVDTIFFGGGTPSRTSRENLTRVVDALRSAFTLRDPEFSLEANPEDVDADAIDFWRTLGVNRLSIGVQSFHDAELRPLGRVHGRERALEAVRIAVASGVRTSLDLILGLPNQTAASFRETLDLAIAGGVGHLSLYMLDLEEGTALVKQLDGGRMT